MANEVDQVNSGALATTIGLVAFATLAVALAVTALVRQEVSARHAQDDTQENDVRSLRAEQQATLTAGIAWVDQKSGIARLPIDQAMKLTVEKISHDPKMLSPAQDADAAIGAGGAGAESASPEDSSVTDTKAATQEQPAKQEESAE
ncbi:MAG: hypothetical protein MK135_09080 [Polyangiaceae bacterium]|nr:hypothetical protein [Polyangiaceae bacterium]